MLFEESDLLKELPEQFFAGLVVKVNAKVAEGADIINLGQEIPTNRPMTILLRPCVSQRKILPITSIRSFVAIVLLRKQLLVFTRTIMGLIWIRSVKFVSWVGLRLVLWNCPSFDESW